MNIEKYTEKSKSVIANASNIAMQNGNEEIQDFHLFLSLIDNQQNLIYQLLSTNMEINIDNMKILVQEGINKFPKLDRPQAMRFSEETDLILNNSEKQATSMKDEYVSVEHIMLALIEKGSRELIKVFKIFGINKTAFLVALKEVRQNVSVKSDNPESSYDVLNKFCKDVTEQVRQNKIDPVIGRDDEIRNVMRILSRKTKNNPCLIGEPGVGKTAIVEALAQRIVRGDVPNSLKGKTIYSLDLGLLVAGAKYKGEFEERLNSLLEEIDASSGKIILFIDEIHQLVGAGKGEGAMDAANLLKPKLARGELHCVGATTLDEYREYIEKDPALARRFQSVLVEEPSVNDAITILRGIQEKFEIFHGVKIQDQALIQAAMLSDRYITDRYLPDKAIDLIDEACAMIRTEMESMPTEVDEVSRKIMQLEIEEAALSREEDTKSKERLEKVQQELEKLRQKFNEMKAKWEEEKKVISRIQKLKGKIDEVNAQIEQAERAYDLNKAAELKYSTLPQLKQVLSQEEKEIEKNHGKSGLLRNKVTADEIAQIVGKWTGIPVTKLVEGERKKLLQLEETLHKSIVGQDEAVKKVSEAIIRSRAGIANPNRPIGSFLFLGPTGVGKTELAKTLARNLFDDEKNMIRFDMSEYMEKFSVTRLIGAPPGYVGYEEGGQLTEAVRHKPYSVLLFDEVEKAHPDVFNIFLQILDDGRLTDSKGRTVDFKNSIIILTSNLGAISILESISENGIITDEAKEEVNMALRSHFRPEFLNRLDETIYFQALGKEQVYGIVEIMLSDLRNRLQEQGFDLSVTSAAIDYLIEIGYDINFGARPLKRTIQSEIETLISKRIISGEIEVGNLIQVFFDQRTQALGIKQI